MYASCKSARLELNHFFLKKDKYIRHIIEIILALCFKINGGTGINTPEIPFTIT